MRIKSLCDIIGVVLHSGVNRTLFCFPLCGNNGVLIRYNMKGCSLEDLCIILCGAETQ